MKRDIQFRAWHIAEEKMCDIDVISFKRHGAFLYGTTPTEDFDYGKTIVIAPLDGRFCDNAEFELMQYTGLKDKNLKEIYEGDILHCIFNGIYRKVEHFKGCFWFMAIGKDWKYPINMINEDHLEDMVVIGNIYETPSLLHTGAEG